MTVIYAVGDAATGNTDSSMLAAIVKTANPDHFLYLGDVYENGTAQEFKVNYQPSWGQLDDRVWPIPGNHDWPNYTTGYQPYFANSIHDLTYYEVGIPNVGWNLLMCNSEEPMDTSSAQFTYFASKSFTNRNNIACWHRPRYCSGSHNDAIDTDPLWQLLAPHCAIILSGHAHNVQVFKPDDTGCIQVISGAGGRGLYAELPDDPRLQWGEAEGYAVARLELKLNALNLSFIDEQGHTLWQKVINT